MSFSEKIPWYRMLARLPFVARVSRITCSVCLDPELVQKLESIQAHARGNAARSLVAGEGKLRPAADCSFRRNPFPCTGT